MTQGAMRRRLEIILKIRAYGMGDTPIICVC